MKKKIIVSCLLGASLGLTISMVISIIISISVGDGRFYPVVPELISDCGNELNAVLLQTVCSLIYGAAWVGASAVWRQDNWSIPRQTVTHLVICSMATFPVAYFTRWTRHSVSGVLSYFGIFFGIYLVIWLSQYSSMKKRVEEMNRKARESGFDEK